MTTAPTLTAPSATAPTLSDLHALDAAAMPSIFTLPEDVALLRDEVREFARTRLRPRVLDNDLAAADDFDWDIVRAGHELGLLRLTIPKELGGRGVGVLGVAVAMEELAAVCASTALIFGASMLGATAVLFSGDPQLQARFIPPFLGDEPVLACNAVTEEVAGCDLLIPAHAADAAEVMTARRDGDHFVLNGIKRFITNGKVAQWATVFANLEGYPGATGMTVFVVPLDNPGVVRGAVADKMGYRACLGTTLEFHDVRVPEENIVFGEANGWGYLNVQSNQARTIVAAISTGVARGAFDIAKDWAGERVQGGKPLSEQQFTARKLAEMAAKVEASRLLYLQAAYQAENMLPAPVFGAAVAKLFADRAAIEVAEEAMSIVGARGYCREYGLEKLVRESFGARIYEGTPEVLALAITDSLYGRRQ
ncbi:acyl-CoA dehydrogenase family protein [Nocardia macrotermitis]|uniref:Cyclohex-1-ene-1-carbonyl-CoA dehydrogenase n=1 Tax=Nocardia macrotermitis TaxID=2585198 RepID=A0A7K0DAI4_9NOCA|nr:acyl-CoA dehydrogenase family protein [Nocardia macrotermitis]MQY22609.1 Cyclohex-1-ene-1-carbonyl-CoA dehydrogenase [Nocardia macrotermitis]